MEAECEMASTLLAMASNGLLRGWRLVTLIASSKHAAETISPGKRSEEKGAIMHHGMPRNGTRRLNSFYSGFGLPKIMSGAERITIARVAKIGWVGSIAKKDKESGN